MEEMMVHLIVGTMVFAAGFLIAFGGSVKNVRTRLFGLGLLVWPIIYANLILTDVEQVAIAATVREDISGTGFLNLLSVIFPVGLTVLFTAGLAGGVLGVISLFVVLCWRERALHA
jgi:hypothetical protein